MKIELVNHIFKKYIGLIIDEQEVVELKALYGVDGHVLEVVGIRLVGVNDGQEDHVPVLLLLKVGTLSQVLHSKY